MNNVMRLLLVDDDQELCTMLADYLESEGFEVESTQNGLSGLNLIEQGRHSLVILDMMLPGLSGMQVLKRARETSLVPIIFLTAKGDTSDRIVGLELGADDYLSKPFDPRELLARINAVIRRGSPPRPLNEIRVNDLRMVQNSRTSYLSASQLKLTSVEFDLLLALAKNAGQVVSRDDLANEIGRTLLPFDRTIDMHILNLRRKIDEVGANCTRILTVRGSGYMLPVDESYR